MIIFNYFFYILILLFTFQIIFNKNNFHLIILSGLFSLFSTAQYILFNSPDVAITEASIGVCLSSVFALKFLSQFGGIKSAGESLNQQKNFLPQENFKISLILKNKKKLTEILFFGFFCILFFFSFYKLSQDPGWPSFKIFKFGEFNEKIYNESTVTYFQKTKDEIGIKNVVTALLAFFRGYDTFIETLVVLTAGTAVFFVLGDDAKIEIKKKDIQQEEMAKSFIIYRICFFFIPFIILFGFYLQIHGEESPGGGFQAGAILTTAFVLYALIISEDAVLNFFSIKNLLRFGALGGMIYLLTGLYPIFLNFIKDFKLLGNNLFLNYDHILCSENLLDMKCLKTSRKIGIIFVELGVGVCVFFITLSLFLNLRLNFKK